MVRVILLQLKRTKLKRQLNERDLKNFDDIVEYIEMSPLNSLEREEVFQQVLDMILQAKSEGKFVNEVIGDDIKGFCDSIIKESSSNKNIFQVCFNYVESFFQVGLIGFVLFFIINLITNGRGNAFKVLDLVTINLIAYMVAILVLPRLIRRKKLFKKKNKADYSWTFLFVFIFLLLNRVVDNIHDKFPQLAITTVIPYGNKIFLLMVFITVFGRDIAYLIKSINKK